MYDAQSRGFCGGFSIDNMYVYNGAAAFIVVMCFEFNRGTAQYGPFVLSLWWRRKLPDQLGAYSRITGIVLINDNAGDAVNV